MQQHRNTAEALAVAGLRKKRNPALSFLKRLFTEKPLGAIGFVVALMLLFAGIFAPWLSPYDYQTPALNEAFKPPSLAHWLGTDQLGRDQFSRIVWGARVSIIVAFSATALFLIVGVVIGMLSGYIGGWVDAAVQRLVDGWMTIPTLVILLALVGIVGNGITQIIVVLAIDRGISTARVFRAEALSLRETAFVESARAIGASQVRIFLIHVLPNAFATVIIMATISVGAFILAEASLSFLGYGVPPPFPTWGSMLSGPGLSYMTRAPWMAIWPGVALSLAVWSFNVLGDALRDMLDPRLRGAGSGA